MLEGETYSAVRRWLRDRRQVQGLAGLEARAQGDRRSRLVDVIEAQRQRRVRAGGASADPSRAGRGRRRDRTLPDAPHGAGAESPAAIESPGGGGGSPPPPPPPPSPILLGASVAVKVSPPPMMVSVQHPAGPGGSTRRLVDPPTIESVTFTENPAGEEATTATLTVVFSRDMSGDVEVAQFAAFTANGLQKDRWESSGPLTRALEADGRTLIIDDMAVVSTAPDVNPERVVYTPGDPASPVDTYGRSCAAQTVVL